MSATATDQQQRIHRSGRIPHDHFERLLEQSKRRFFLIGRSAVAIIG